MSQTSERADRPPSPVFCTMNCGYFSNPECNGMCSICYRNFLSKEKQAKKAEESPDSTIPQSEANTPININPIQQELKVESVGVPPKRRRQSCCPVCKKRVGLLAFKCRCGGQFCETHRYPEAHQCSFDHKSIARSKIQDENPIVLSDKLDRV